MSAEGSGAPAPETAAVRVLHVVGSVGFGGAESMLMTLYRTVDRARVQFDFLVFGDEPGAYEAEILSLGGRLLRMPAPGQLGMRAALGMLTSLLRAEGPFAAVHSHVNFASAFALLAARRAVVPVRVAHSHTSANARGSGRRALYRTASRALTLRVATDLLACSDDAGRHLFGAAWTRHGTILRNTIDPDRYLDGGDRVGTRLRSEWGISGDAIVVGSVGRLVAVKNHAFLLSVLKSIGASEPQPVLVVAGEGPLRSRMAQEAVELGVEKRLRLLGPRRDVPDLLHVFDVLALPSLHEGIPLVLIEAQAAGLTCIVSDSVTRDVDLGLGLIKYLPLAEPEVWAAELQRQPGLRPGADEVREALLRQGYTAPQALETLLGVYGLAQ